ncbi:MAG: TIGR04290 family methyltransferase [Candidatus Abyssobacteria bacterium SURF_5]|uniref:TIGR04290 family methyltransferase n=1 Tax=Abyssobacteria bacterium (strain SURF_5) TaxID=2093360 RepID=A0A3A4N3K3_ABYX5|nr:MAG: TIGR04290 family methyltransferase [Candidatus Abyssubacteria bacterium SURF_5]
MPTLEAYYQNPRTPIEHEIAALGPWFHNLHLPGGIQTAPQHPLGDFPAYKWQPLAPYLPDDLSGCHALDVGCNAGFYSFQLARRGATVLGIDIDHHYLRQAQWAAEKFELQRQVSFEYMQVYEIARLKEDFDVVWFMGVFYHLRYPLLALDILSRKTKKMLVFQTLTMPEEEVYTPPPDIGIHQRELMLQPGWPKMAFIEFQLNGDPTNWWAPNRAAVEAILRSCGLEILHRPAHETYICRPGKGGPSRSENFIAEEMRSALGVKPSAST